MGGRMTLPMARTRPIAKPAPVIRESDIKITNVCSNLFCVLKLFILILNLFLTFFLMSILYLQITMARYPMMAKIPIILTKTIKVFHCGILLITKK